MDGLKAQVAVITHSVLLVWPADIKVCGLTLPLASQWPRWELHAHQTTTAK